VFRCGTEGPDINGEYSTGHPCDITCWSKVLREKDAEIERLRAQLAVAHGLLRECIVGVGLERFPKWLDETREVLGMTEGQHFNAVWQENKRAARAAGGGE
jgi:hypothetical protein